MSLRLRGRLTILNPDGSLAHESPWGPWMLGTTNLGRLLQGIFTPEALSATGGTGSRTLTDITGANRTVFMHQMTNALNQSSPFNYKNTNGDAGSTATWVQVGWGNGAGSPARADTEISGAQSRFNCSSQTNDETNGTVSVTGSSVSGVATNVTRIGLYLNVYSSALTGPHVMLMDHSTVSSAAVAVGQTVAVTYQIAY